jgi:hypothetical protein
VSDDAPGVDRGAYRALSSLRAVKRPLQLLLGLAAGSFSHAIEIARVLVDHAVLLDADRALNLLQRVDSLAAVGGPRSALIRSRSTCSTVSEVVSPRTLNR